MTRPPIDQQVTFLYTHDLEKTAVFYEEILQLPLVLDQGSCRIYRVSGDAFLGFCRHGDAPAEPVAVSDRRTVIVTLVTAEVDAWYEHLKEQGITFEKPPAHNPAYNIYHCFLRDPNGYLLEIQQFLDPAWPS
jgi:catechol 2,3-dioxygenase-like lactoylglutathione lyase family enzyme